MKTLNDEEQKWKMKSFEKENKSELHKNAAALIRNVFPTIQFKEEVQIEVKKGKFLYLDFYIPLLKIGIEVQGSQHTNYNNFFYKNPLGFIKQKINDHLKENWCETNNITLIKLNYDEQPSEWRAKLANFGINKPNA